MMYSASHTGPDELKASVEVSRRDSRTLQLKRMDQFERGEIDGYIVRRDRRRVFVDALPRIITDEAS